MLKLRIDIALLLNDAVLFRTRRFRPDYRYTARFVEPGSCDELIILDITRKPTAESRARFWAKVEEISAEAFIPRLVGGNLRTMDDVDDAIRRHGSEGVILGRAAIVTPELVSGVAERYGSQACTVAIDFLPDGTVQPRGEPALPGYGSRSERRLALPHAQFMVGLGAGQLLLTSMDRDGSLDGYDLRLLQDVVRSVPVPVMIAGGCGNWQHMVEAFRAGAAACVTSNIFHMTALAMRAAHDSVAMEGLPVRKIALVNSAFVEP